MTGGKPFRRVIAWTAPDGERFKSKKAALAAGWTLAQLVKVLDASWTIAYRAYDPKVSRVRQIWEGGFKTKGSAEAVLKQRVRAVDEGTYIRPTKLTVAEFLTDKWLPSVKVSLRPTTVSMYTGYINAHIIERLGPTPIRALAPEQLNAFYAALLENGRKDGKGGLSPRATRICHVILHRALADAVKWGLLTRNPASAAEPPSDGTTEKDVYTPGQVVTFLRHVAEDRLFALWQLAAATGARRGELLGLRWEDVDLDRKPKPTVTISQTVTVVDHKAVIVPKRAKTKQSRRTISIDADTAEALKAHKARQAEERLALGPGWTDTGLVFTREDGTVLHPERISKWFDRHRRAASLPYGTLHTLRHSHATALLQAGVPVRTVSARLGHENANVTMAIYSHVLPGNDEDAADIGAEQLRVAAARAG